MHSLKRQNGMTAIGWMFVLLLIGFFALLALKMVPMYMEYFKVAQSLESLVKDQSWDEASPRAIRRVLERRFDVNYVTTISPRQVSIRPVGGSYVVTANYDAKEHILGNVYVLMQFNKSVRVPRN